MALVRMQVSTLTRLMAARSHASCADLNGEVTAGASAVPVLSARLRSALPAVGDSLMAASSAAGDGGSTALLQGQSQVCRSPLCFAAERRKHTHMHWL